MLVTLSLLIAPTPVQLQAPELSTDAQDLEIGICKEVSFSVNEQVYRNNFFNYAQVVAKGILKADKELSEQIARAAVTKLNSFAGLNEAANPIWTIASTKTTVPQSNWNMSLIPKLIVASQRNRMSDPALISGENLYEEFWNAMANARNLDGTGNAFRAQALRHYNDLFNVELMNTAGSPAVTSYFSYLVDRGCRLCC